MGTQVTQNTHQAGGWGSTIAYGLSLLFVCLFLYTVYHKAVGMEAFEKGITRIPYLGSQAGTVAWGILAAEVLASLLIIWPDTNRFGLWGALALMLVFTVYIGSMLLFAESLPCHCGGAIEKLTWQQHLLFNCGFIALAAGLLLYDYKANLKQLILKAMSAITVKVKKAIFGMLVALLAVGFSAYTINQEPTNEQNQTVGRLADNQWIVINPTERGSTWDCEITGPVCLGTLKPDATPNEDGSYNNSEVDYPDEPQDEHFVLL